MREALVFIGFGEQAQKVGASIPYRLIIGGEPQGFSTEDLKGGLLAFYQDFKAKGTERVRYIILFSPSQSFTLSPLDVHRIASDLHREAILLPFESEAFVLLPSVNSDRAAKAGCFRFFEALEAAPGTGSPEITWLIDTDRLPSSLAGDLISLYLSTEVYRSFNAQVETGVTKEKSQVYSSLGAAKLVFPAKKWHQYLSLMFEKDLLNVRTLSSLSVNLDTARMALSQILPFLKSKIAKISEAVSRPATFPQADILLEGLAIDEEERLEKFLARLKLHINQEKAKRWHEISPEVEIFCRAVKKELESILDEAPHGLYSAWGFIGLLLASGGPYMEFLKDLDPWPEDLSGISLQSFLFGWQEKNPSPPLDLLFNEVVRELRQFYQLRLLPFPEPTTWKALLEELRRLLELPELDTVLAEGRKFIETLKENTEIIVMAKKKPYSLLLSGKDLERFLDLLEARAREQLQRVIDEVSPVRKEFEELEKKVAALGWRKYLPWYWSLLSRIRAQKAEFQRAKMRLKEAYLQVLERRRILFACYFAPFAAERLSDLLTPLKGEVETFVSLLAQERFSIEQKMEGMDFGLPPFGLQVVEGEEDIKSLYHHHFPPQDIPRLFDEFLQSLKEPVGPTPKLSHFYTPAEKRNLFVQRLGSYSQANFAWIREWGVRKVITYLKKGNKMASSLEKKSGAFLQVKDPIPTDLQIALFVGLDDESHNPFSSSAFSGQGPLFYSHGDAELITGLRLSHGFSAFAIEGWEHWKTCAQKEKGELK